MSQSCLPLQHNGIVCLTAGNGCNEQSSYNFHRVLDQQLDFFHRNLNSSPLITKAWPALNIEQCPTVWKKLLLKLAPNNSWKIFLQAQDFSTEIHFLSQEPLKIKSSMKNRGYWKRFTSLTHFASGPFYFYNKPAKSTKTDHHFCHLNFNVSIT